MKILLIILFSISTVFAQNVQTIKKGEQAPSDGFFVTKEQMQKFVNTDKENVLLKKKIVKLEQLQFVQKERITLYKNRVEVLDKQLSWEQTKGSFKGIGGFFIGVLATSAAAYAAIQVSK